MSPPLHDRPRVDHLVVMADTLDAGVAWCEATLGMTPGPGGEHTLFGTHNRVLAVASAAFPLAYLEIIAINPAVACARATAAIDQKRWFDMDDEDLRKQVRLHGPQLIHWVARVPDVHEATARLATLEIDRGEVLRASRKTPHGLLEWQITVRPDGRRLFDGCLPTLIEWGGMHPATELPDSGLVLRSLTLKHPRITPLAQACAALDVADLGVQQAPQPAIEAVLATPRGQVVLSSARDG